MVQNIDGATGPDVMTNLLQNINTRCRTTTVVQGTLDRHRGVVVGMATMRCSASFYFNIRALTELAVYFCYRSRFQGANANMRSTTHTSIASMIGAPEKSRIMAKYLHMSQPKFETPRST